MSDLPHDLGIHVLLDLGGCEAALLADRDALQAALRDAATRAGATIVGEAFHAFSPTGVSGVLLLAESHLSIHTWPERGAAALDVFSCGDRFDADVAADLLALALRATTEKRRRVLRAIESGERDGASTRARR